MLSRCEVNRNHGPCALRAASGISSVVASPCEQCGWASSPQDTCCPAMEEQRGQGTSQANQNRKPLRDDTHSLRTLTPTYLGTYLDRSGQGLSPWWLFELSLGDRGTLDKRQAVGRTHCNDSSFHLSAGCGRSVSFLSNHALSPHRTLSLNASCSCSLQQHI